MSRLLNPIVLITAIFAMPAMADINIGVIFSLTGPAAGLGTETKKSADLFPTTIGKEKVNFIVLDDATDPTQAVKNARKLIAENKVDALLGPNTVSNAIAIADVANAEKVPMVSVAPLEVGGEKRTFVFRSEPSADLMVRRIVNDMAERRVKTVGFIGFSDSWGDLLLKALNKEGDGKVNLVATERFSRADPSVKAQVLKIISAKPDAVFIAASGAPAALPQITLRESGYKGPVYQSHGVATPAFLQVGGKAVEGALLPVGPALVAEQLPADNPTKKVGETFVKRLDARNSRETRSSFVGAAWDAWLLLENGINAALKAKAKPGTEEFRAAIRNGLEKTSKLVGVNGVYNLSPSDHAGYDPSAIVLITVENGHWKLIK